MNYKAVIFDLDGTVLDTLEDLTDATNFALGQNGYPQRTIDEIRSIVGNGIRNLVTRALPEETPPQDLEKTFRDFRTYYGDHCADKTKPYAGIPELLKDLRGAGLKTAVVSNKADFAVRELCTHYFDGLFDACMGEKESEGISKKPAPDMINLILSQLGLSREEAVYVGDSEVDLKTANNAQMDCISVTWGFRSPETLIQNGATRLINSPQELLRALTASRGA